MDAADLSSDLTEVLHTSTDIDARLAEVARHDPAARAGADDDRVVAAGALGVLGLPSRLGRRRPGPGPLLHRPHRYPFAVGISY